MGDRVFADNGCLTRRGALRALCTTVFLLGLLLPLGAAAQQEQSEPAAPEASPERLEELITTLEDEAARQRLVEQLRALLAAQQAAEEAAPELQPEGFVALLLAELSKGVDRMASQLGEATEALIGLPQAADSVWEQAQDPQVRRTWLDILGKIVLILAAGLLAEYVTRRLLARPRRVLGDREGDSLVLRFVFLLTRTALDLVPIAAFAATAYGILPLTEPRPVTRLVALTVINANVIVRVVMAVARMLLMPDAAALRVVRMSDETANYVTIWVRRLAGVGVFGYFIAEAALLLGLPRGAHQVLLKLVGLLVAGLAIVVVLQNRAAAGAWIRGPIAPEVTAKFLILRRRLAEVWHVLAIVFLLAVYGVWALGVEGGFRYLATSAALTAVVLVLANLVLAGLRKGLERGFRIRADLKERFPRLEARANQYLTGLHKALRAAVFALSVLLILDIWFGVVFDWLTSDAGRFVMAHIATIALILVGALVVWEVVTLLIERHLESRGQDGTEVQRSARVRTLLPLLRNVVRVVLAVIVVLTVLAELGVNIAPLLAGAGVVGLAIGFGAQSLVKDVITGTFILLEDAIAVGEVVDLGGKAGLVEGMTIRSIRLRDVSGNVHVVPFGEVTALTNMTKGFAFALIEVGVAYREDVDEVIEILKAVGEELRADETYGPLILEPLEVMGLDSFGDSSVNIRVRLKTLPIKQWMVRREFNRRMKRVFDEKGIEIPFPHVTLYFGVDKQGDAPPARIRQEAGPAAPASKGNPGSTAGR